MIRAGGYPVASEPKLKTERLRTIWKLTETKIRSVRSSFPYQTRALPGAESRTEQLYGSW